MARIRTHRQTNGGAVISIGFLIGAAFVILSMLSGCEGAYTIAPEEVATWHQGVDPADPEPPCYENSGGENGTLIPCDNSSVPSDSTTTPEPDPAPNGAAGG